MSYHDLGTAKYTSEVCNTPSTSINCFVYFLFFNYYSFKKRSAPMLKLCKIYSKLYCVNIVNEFVHLLEPRLNLLILEIITYCPNSMLIQMPKYLCPTCIRRYIVHCIPQSNENIPNQLKKEKKDKQHQ